MTTNFADRFARELNGKVAAVFEVHAPPKRMYSAWIGGAMLGSLSTFNDVAVHNAEYGEEGAAVFRRKCL